MMLPNIKFFATMSLVYISLGVLWAGSYARYWKDVATLQHCATAVVALGMMEMSTWCVSAAVTWKRWLSGSVSTQVTLQVHLDLSSAAVSSSEQVPKLLPE